MCRFSSLWSAFLATMCLYGMYFVAMTTVFGTVPTLNVDATMCYLKAVPLIVMFLMVVPPVKGVTKTCSPRATRKKKAPTKVSSKVPSKVPSTN
jgi:hypothetical protein